MSFAHNRNSSAAFNKLFQMVKDPDVWRFRARNLLEAAQGGSTRLLRMCLAVLLLLLRLLLAFFMSDAETKHDVSKGTVGAVTIPKVAVNLGRSGSQSFRSHAVSFHKSFRQGDRSDMRPPLVECQGGGWPAEGAWTGL